MKVTAVIFSAGAVMKNDDGLLKGSMLFQIIGGILKFFFKDLKSVCPSVFGALQASKPLLIFSAMETGYGSSTSGAYLHALTSGRIQRLTRVASDGSCGELGDLQVVSVSTSTSQLVKHASCQKFAFGWQPFLLCNLLVWWQTLKQ